MKQKYKKTIKDGLLMCSIVIPIYFALGYLFKHLFGFYEPSWYFASGLAVGNMVPTMWRTYHSELRKEILDQAMHDLEDKGMVFDDPVRRKKD